MPPKLRVKPPKRSDLPIAGKPWGNADLPIDILLLTVEDCEFLSCFSFLDRPFKSYKEEVGPIYFGYTGNNGDQEKLKVALMKCSKGAAVPGGSLTAVKNAVRVLSPKAVFSVGTCSGLSSDKVKLGDVVVSAKLTTAAGFKSPVSRRMSDLVRDAPYGWVAPLENPDELEVEVHCDGDILSETPAARYGCADLHLQYPEAIALETEGEGVFAAAYDEKIEWVVVKGVARFVNQTELSRGEWMSFASTMAASVVAKMLNDPVVFQEWPHCNQDASFEPQMSSDAQGKLKRKCDISLTDHGLSSKKAQEEEEESKEHADISFTGHGLSQKKARGEEKESKQHSDSSLTHPDPSQKKAKEEEKEVKQHADVILKVVLKLACGGVWVAGTALILTKYRDDPEKMIQLFQQIALPAGVVLKYLFEGSITCILQVIDLHGWQTLWENFESGLLKKHLENVLITEDLYKLAKGDEIIMEVFLEETITAHLSVTSGLVARGGSFIHPEPSRKKEEEEEEVKQHADASCDVHVPPEARGRLHIKSSEDEKDASSDVEMPSEALARLHIKSSDDEKDSSFTHPDPSQKKAKEEEKEVKQYAASSHGNDDDRSDDSDIHPVIAVAGDDDDEFGDEEGKEEEVALEAERLERRTGIARCKTIQINYSSLPVTCHHHPDPTLPENI